mgnify:CR=1 FL=1
MVNAVKSRSPDTPSENKPINRQDSEQGSDKGPDIQCPEIIHPQPKQRQEPKDVYPQQTSDTDNQGCVISLIRSVRVMIRGK